MCTCEMWFGYQKNDLDNLARKTNIRLEALISCAAASFYWLLAVTNAILSCNCMKHFEWCTELLSRGIVLAWPVCLDLYGKSTEPDDALGEKQNGKGERRSVCLDHRHVGRYSNHMQFISTYSVKKAWFSCFLCLPGRHVPDWYHRRGKSQTQIHPRKQQVCNVTIGSQCQFLLNWPDISN